MNPITIPMMVKATHPLLTPVLLVSIGAVIGFVLYLMLRHQYRTRKDKKNRTSPHSGRHDNH